MTGLLILTFIVGFSMAVAIGANDVANSMATAVGARALTPRQAVLVASVLEFAGATLFGKTVTETIRKGIVSPSLLSSREAVICGALAALIGATVWVFVATYFKMPVSTTHSVVGGMIGFGLAAGGPGVVNWKVLGKIVMSWVISPIFGLALAFLIFKLLSRLILSAAEPQERSKVWAPVFIGLTVLIVTASFVLKTLHIKSLHLALTWGALMGLATGVGFFIYFKGKDLLNWRKGKRIRREHQYQAVENLFKNLQIMTSCYVSLAHGANDIANAVGPVAAVYAALHASTVGKEVSVPVWILALGGLGISIGVALFGHRVMKTVGNDITDLTNTRGFTIDFSTATTVLFASNAGLPISTTHTVVGSVMGVGFARGLNAVNLKVVYNILYSWLITVPVAAAISYLLYNPLMRIFGG